MAYISIHALLAESNGLQTSRTYFDNIISIHALLAESDNLHVAIALDSPNFNPRSPCGERPCTWRRSARIFADFNPRSPCGERRRDAGIGELDLIISIHALLAESDRTARCLHGRSQLFQSTLSLRRATIRALQNSAPVTISIHALLAESDQYSPLAGDPVRRFQSTLSLRRATYFPFSPAPYTASNFNPRSPCGERLVLTLCFG